MTAKKKAKKPSSRAGSEAILPRDYSEWLSSLESLISSARQRATVAVNHELVRLYHHIGSQILERQTRQGWGAKVIDRVSADLRAAFPEMRGFSSRNLEYMKAFAQACPAGLIGQQPAAQLPWFHIVTLLTKVSVEAEPEWYAAQITQRGWSRTTLDIHITNTLHLRQGVAVTNFERQLPSPHARHTHHRPLALQDQEPLCCRVLTFGGQQADWRGGVSTGTGTSRAARYQSA